MYDFAHCLSDSIEGITHSICTLEFEIHRPLYNWYLETLGIKNPPQQIEFARLNITGTVMSKRKLLQLVTEHHVNGWDDPRMPTIAGMRRRGFTPEAIRNFCEQIGVAKADSTVDMSFLEHCVREDLNKRAKRIMVVVNPVKLIIDNYPEGQTEEVEAINNPENMDEGKRKVIFSKELYIDRDDFMEEPVKGFYRMAPDREVRLKAGYYVKCTGVVKDENGEIKEIHCTYDPETKGGTSADGRKVKGTLHWVSATNCVDTEVRIYENLFNCQNPSAAENFLDTVNHDSLKIVKGSKAELCVNDLKVGDVVQFERTGYFCLDKDSTEGHPVFNRTIALKDTWAKQNKK
jgi:glutaminyl-tRNA synthetase